MIVCLMVFPVLMGRAACKLAERAGEVTAVIEGEQQRDLCDAHIRFPKHRCGMTDFCVHDIGVQGHGCRLLNQSVDIARMIIEDFG